MLILYKLSILICNLVGRETSLNNLLDIINDQTTPDIEVLVDTDNREVTTGEKRNRLLEAAKGEYVAFVDDDDTISDNYCSLILNAIESKPDVVGMKGIYYVSGVYVGVFEHSIKYRSWQTLNGNIFLRNPNHLSPIRREYSLMAKFPCITFAEDKEYSTRLLPLLKTEVMIETPIYNYMATQK
jgi:glycosyltransferase involved in cell wall biosynthesis